MVQKYRITAEEARKIKEYRKGIKDKKEDRRLYAVQLLGEGKSAKYISEKLDADRRQISEWAKKFCERGRKAEKFSLSRGGRRSGNMTYEEEAEFLAPFIAEAEAGQMVEVGKIKAAYDKAIGHKSGHETIYKVLRRHGWRQVMPRSRHPKKADEDTIKSSKKLNQK